VHKRALILFLTLIFGFAMGQEDLEDLSLEELLDVSVVSPTQKAIRISQTPSVIRVITAEEIEKKGYRSIGEALSSIPGVYVYFDGVNYNVNIRGITGGMRGNNRIVKVMIDNQPVPYAYSGANLLGPETIPIEAVKRIEVVIGPGSTLYGANAYMGVINIVTKTGDDYDGGLVNLALGTENSKDVSFRGNLSYGQHRDNIDYMLTLSGAGLNRTGLKVPPTSLRYAGMESENDVAHPYSVHTKVALFNNKLGKLTFDGNLQYLDSYAEFADWGILTHNNRISLHNYYARLRYNRRAGDNLYATGAVSVSGGGTNPDNSYDYGSDMFSVRKKEGFLTLRFHAQIEYSPSTKISVAMGTNILSESFKGEKLWYYLAEDYGVHSARDSVELTSPAPDTSFGNIGVYTQAIYKPSEKLSFTQGLIYSHHSAYGDFYNIRFGTVYKFNEEAHAKFLFGTSFKTPSPEQLFGQPLFAGDAVGNPNLLPEKNKTFDIEITPANTEDFGAVFNLFYNFVDDKISYVYRDGMYRAENLRGVKVMGAEASIRWNFKNLSTRWNVSYQYTDIAEEDADSVFEYTFVPGEIFEYPRLMSYSSFSYMIPKIKIGFSFEQKYVGERSASQSNIALNGGKKYKIPAYQVLNLNIFTKRLHLLPFGKTRLSLSIKNLTDEEYIEPGHNGIDIPGLRRTLYFSITNMF